MSGSKTLVFSHLERTPTSMEALQTCISNISYVKAGKGHDETTETTHQNEYTLTLGVTQMIVGAAGTVLTSSGSNEAVQVLLTGLEEGLRFALDEGHYF